MIKNIQFQKISKFFENNRYSAVLISLVLFVLVGIFTFTNTYKLFELKLYDLRFKTKSSIAQWDKITFVDIDERSLEIVGEFPWRRYFYANGMDALGKAGIHSYALDIMFLDRSPLQLDENLYFKLLKGRGAVKKEDFRSIVVSDDDSFANASKTLGRTIFPYVFSASELDEQVLKRRDSARFKKAFSAFLKKSSITVVKKNQSRYEGMAKGNRYIIPPIPKLMYSGKHFGFVDRDSDIDGVTRKISLVKYYNGRLFFNMAFMMFLDSCDVSLDSVEVIPGEQIFIKKMVDPFTQLSSTMSIPINDEGMMIINWAGPGAREKSFRLIPFSALLEYKAFTAEDSDNFYDQIESQGGTFVLSGLYEEQVKLELEYSRATDKNRLTLSQQITNIKKKIHNQKRGYIDAYSTSLKGELQRLGKKKDPKMRAEILAAIEDIKVYESALKVDALKDAVVITGLTAAGTHDLGATPTHSEYARVGIYPNALNTIVQREFITRVPIWINLILMFLFSIVAGLIVQILDAKKAMLAVVAMLFIINGFAIITFSFLNLWFQQLGIVMATILPAVVLTSIKYMSEENQRKFIKGAFSRYLSISVINEIIKNPKSLELGGENREITIFFSDVQGFSSISEKLTPPELVKLLNEYLTAMTNIILKYDGTIDKYEGDAIMAFWGAPLSFEDHALKCCYAILDMKKELRAMQDKWKEVGQLELYARMGVNTGEAVVGNMGSETRMDYTAMGDSVNLASRLEGANKYYNTYSMISEATYRAVEDYVEVRKLDIIRVVGKTEPIKIFELISRKGKLPENMIGMLALYDEALALFENRKWKKSKAKFEAALEVIPDDGPSLTYVKRCQQYMVKPPSENWDGVYKLKSK